MWDKVLNQTNAVEGPFLKCWLSGGKSCDAGKRNPKIPANIQNSPAQLQSLCEANQIKLIVLRSGEAELETE